MASDLQLRKVSFPPEEEEFHQILRQIGGKGNVYLVGDVHRQEGECKCSLMKEFMAELFPEEPLYGEVSCNGEEKSQCCSGSKAQQPGPRIRATSDKGRAMHCGIVIFLFRHAYLHDKPNHVCVREVLKDIRTRTEGHGARPALIGLVHAPVASPETGQSVELLEQMMRSVFPNHPHDSIWAGHFIPKELDGMQDIKRHMCKSVLSAQVMGEGNVPGRKGHFFRPLRQWLRRGQSSGPGAASDNQEDQKKGFPCKRGANHGSEDQDEHWTCKTDTRFRAAV